MKEFVSDYGLYIIIAIIIAVTLYYFYVIKNSCIKEEKIDKPNTPDAFIKDKPIEEIKQILEQDSVEISLE